MSGSNAVMEVYLTGLRNQHAVETQAIGTIKNQLSRMEPYPDLHTKMQQEMERSTTQAARLDDLLSKHGTSKSVAKEAVTGTVATVAGFVHAGSSDEVLKNVLAAVGFNPRFVRARKPTGPYANLGLAGGTRLAVADAAVKAAETVLRQDPKGTGASALVGQDIERLKSRLH